MPGAGEAGSEARGLPEPHALVREAVEARAAVRRAMEVGEELRRPIEERDEEARDVHFGGKRRTEGGQPDQRLRTAPRTDPLAWGADGVPSTPRGERRERWPRGKPAWLCAVQST